MPFRAGQACVEGSWSFRVVNFRLGRNLSRAAHVAPRLGQAIRLPASSNRIDYEGELAAVIGKPCRDVKAEDAALGDPGLHRRQ